MGMRMEEILWARAADEKQLRADLEAREEQLRLTREALLRAQEHAKKAETGAAGMAARIAELQRQLQIAEGALEMSQAETNLALDEYAEAQNHGLELAAELVEATPGQLRPDDEAFDQGTANDIAAAIRALKDGSHG